MGFLINSGSSGIARLNTEKVLGTTVPAFCLLLVVLAIPDLWSVLVGKPAGAFHVCFAAIVLALLGSLRGGATQYRFAAAAALLFFLSFAAWQLGALGLENFEARPWSRGFAGAGLGMAAVAWRPKPALIYGAVFALMLTIVPALPAGSPHSWNDSWQDGLLTVVTSIVIVAPIAALRHAATSADSAAGAALEKFSELARSQQLAVQRSKLDSLAHDSILSTLIVAAQAHDSSVINAVKESAASALEQLDSFRLAGAPHAEQEIDLAELLQLIRDSTASYKIPVIAPAEAFARSGAIPAHAAHALLQSTLEAVRNAVRHGVAAGKSVEVSAGTDDSSIKRVQILIIDQGPGFDLAAIPKNRLGIKESILGRMQLAHGHAHIDSAPGKGTTVTLSWTSTGDYGG